MNALVLQPPFTQLNTSYPAIWFIDRFLRSRGLDSQAVDLSIECFRSVFSSQGLRLAFATAQEGRGSLQLPDAASRSRFDAYFDQADAYCSVIDNLCAYLSGQDPAFAYRLAVGAGLPLGMRSEAVLGPSGGIALEDAPALATAILNDLGDFIRFALDPHFETVRYAERLPAAVTSFDQVLAVADQSWLFANFLTPLLGGVFARIQADPADGRLLLCITVPFPGCLAGAVHCAQQARKRYGSGLCLVLGGGYVSTELRSSQDPRLFELFDYLCFDGSYASLDSLLSDPQGRGLNRQLRSAGQLLPAGPPPEDLATAEEEAIRTIHPDYRGVDFSRYLRVVDSPNPMHRLWNDTPWLKYRLAYGCYWQRCAFCDTQLHYINHYQPVDLDSLLAAADEASHRHGLYGLHFVDEAMPPAMLRRFAAANRQRNRPYTFWGNIRFDAAWTAELCAEAAASGLVAVSGGIEIATAAGLAVVDKGFSLEQLLRSLSNFKRVGVLVHAYLIYGFPGQTDQDIADSAEMVRVLLAEGLLDSAFWHRFVLTRYSRLQADWAAGRFPALQPQAAASSLAENDLHFAGEEAYDHWTPVLDTALSTWATEGRTELGLAAFLLPGQPKPRIKPYQLLKAAGLIH